MPKFTSGPFQAESGTAMFLLGSLPSKLLFPVAHSAALRQCASNRAQESVLQRDGRLTLVVEEDPFQHAALLGSLRMHLCEL